MRLVSVLSFTRASNDGQHLPAADAQAQFVDGRPLVAIHHPGQLELRQPLVPGNLRRRVHLGSTHTHWLGGRTRALV